MKFAAIIRSTPAIRTLFDESTVHRWWWRAILTLHGKPRSNELSPTDRKRILAAGFQFYGYLYGCLALIMAGVAFALLAVEVEVQSYWPCLAMFASVYLGASASLAFKGARAFATNTTQASAMLIVFFVAIIGFLTLFAGTLAFVVNQQHPEAGIAIALSLAAFALLGIASYLLEILYLFFHGAEDS